MFFLNWEGSQLRPSTSRFLKLKINEMRMYAKKLELKMLKFDRVMNFFVATEFDMICSKISDPNFKVLNFLNCELLTVSFCMTPTIIYYYQLPILEYPSVMASNP